MKNAFWLTTALCSATLAGAYWIAPQAVPHVAVIALACLSVHLTNFLACASTGGNGIIHDLPTQLDKLKEKNAARKELVSLIETLRAQGAVDWGKAFIWGKVTGNAPLTIPECETKLRELDAQINIETELLPTGEQYKNALKQYKEQAMILKGALGDGGSESGYALASMLPGAPSSASKLIGLEGYAARLDRALQEASPIIDRTCEHLDLIASSVKPLLASLRTSQKALAVATSPKSTVKAADEAMRNVLAWSGDFERLERQLLLGEFGEGLDKIQTLVDLLGPHAPVTAKILRDATHSGPTFRLRAKAELDANVFGRIDRGDTLTIQLPCGYRMTKPLQIKASRSMAIAVTGNRAGSNVIAIDVRRCSGTHADVISVRVDQPIEVEDDTCGGGELRVWNLNQANGVVIPVVTIEA